MIYDTYLQMIKKSRGGQSKKLNNNTSLVLLPEEQVAVRVHETDVMVFSPDGRIMYDTGGYATIFTRERMNAYGPFRLFTEEGLWYITVNGLTVQFVDKMVVCAGGTHEGCPGTQHLVTTMWDTDDKGFNRDMKKKIKKYTDQLTPEYLRAALDSMEGDCWKCVLASPSAELEEQFENALSRRSLVPFTEEQKVSEREHYEAHMDSEEFDMPGTMIANALVEMNDASGAAVYYIGIVRRDVRKYLEKRLLKGVVSA